MGWFCVGDLLCELVLAGLFRMVDLFAGERLCVETLPEVLRLCRLFATTVVVWFRELWAGRECAER